jgi:hypothetical protein
MVAEDEELERDGKDPKWDCYNSFCESCFGVGYVEVK